MLLLKLRLGNESNSDTQIYYRHVDGMIITVDLGVTRSILLVRTPSTRISREVVNALLPNLKLHRTTPRTLTTLTYTTQKTQPHQPSLTTPVLSYSP